MTAPGLEKPKSKYHFIFPYEDFLLNIFFPFRPLFLAESKTKPIFILFFRRGKGGGGLCMPGYVTSFSSASDRFCEERDDNFLFSLVCFL